jgi:sugar lactone lactonase YvrE
MLWHCFSPGNRFGRTFCTFFVAILLYVALPIESAAQPTVVEPRWTLIRTIDIAGPMAAHFNERDGRIYFGRRGSGADGLWRIDAYGFAERLAAGSNVSAVAVQPDSGHIFFSEDYGGVVYRTEFGGTGRATWVSGFRSGDDDPVGIAFAPDGYAGSILQPGEALVVDRGNSGYDEVWWWSPFVAEGEYQVHPDDGTLIDPLDVAIGGSTVYLVDSGLAGDGAIYIVEPDSSLTALTTPLPIASPAGITIDPLTQDLLIADQGAGRIVRLVLLGPDQVIDMHDVVTGLTAGSNLWAGVDMTPDGRRLIVTDRAAGKIYVYALCDATAWPGPDCDGDGIYDLCQVVLDGAPDCNHNGVPDNCDLTSGASTDCDLDGVPDDCPICVPVELVFIMDTSTSMNDEAAALCNNMGLIVDYLESAGVEVNPTLFGICNLPGGAYGCLEAILADSLGTVVPGSPPVGLVTLGDCPGGNEVCQEDWGRATAVVAGLFPWQPDSTTIRLVVPLSDEGAWCGDPSSQIDYDSISHAISVAHANDVIVSPITGTGSSSAVIAQAQALADSTGGTRFSSSTLASEIAYGVVQLVLDACARYEDCDGSGVLDECEIAQHPSLDWNHDGVLDRCQRGMSAVIPGASPGTMVRLERNRPNPFNPRTTIAFVLRVPSDARLQIFDLKGRLVRTLFAGTELASGRYEVEWNGRDEAGRRVPSGVFLCRLVAGDEVLTRRMLLLK